jgi:hypothetical protein
MPTGVLIAGKVCGGFGGTFGYVGILAAAFEDDDGER